MSEDDAPPAAARPLKGTVPNPPRKHHYIPQFLLGEWAVNAGKLWRFTQPIPGKIAVKAVSPAEVGYEEFLYETPGLPPEKAQQVEQHFMSPLDSLAAEAHRQLLAGKIDGMPQKDRSAWSRFIMSLWFRTPDGLAYYKEAMGHILTARDEPLEAQYQERREEGYPESLQAAIEQLGPGFVENAAMSILRRLSDDPKHGLTMNNLSWFVIETVEGPEFLISDAALMTSGAGIFSERGYMTLPIAPRKLFVAVKAEAVGDQIRAIPYGHLVAMHNSAVVRYASHFVGATDRSQEAVIRKTFGTEERPSMIRSLAEGYQQAAAGGGQEGAAPQT